MACYGCDVDRSGVLYRFADEYGNTFVEYGFSLIGSIGIGLGVSMNSPLAAIGGTLLSATSIYAYYSRRVNEENNQKEASQIE